MGRTEARPLLKWAGGKTQLLPAIRPFYPSDFNGYLEPFVGSGAVFLDLCNSGRLAGHRVRLMDVNPDVIGCYRAVRRSVEEVIHHLDALADGHRRLGSAHYYQVRDERFNPRRRRRFGRDPAPDVNYPADLAAMLIYLNRTGYNGLFRLNSHGGFNVPAGRYANPRICDADNLRRVAKALSGPGVRLECCSFETIGRWARSGDFIYLDPPYAPLSPTSNFTAYTAGGFTHAHQRRLQQIVISLGRRGCQLLLSNSTASTIEALYCRNDEARAAGLRSHLVRARRAISARATARDGVNEFLITNVRAGSAR